MKKITFTKFILQALLIIFIAVILPNPTYAQYSGTGSISVSPSSITRSGSNWPTLTISGTVNVPGANNSYTVAKVYWKKSTDSGWSANPNLNSFGTNGSYSFSFTPPSSASTGSYQFSLWRMRPDGTANHNMASSGMIQFNEFVCTSSDYGPISNKTQWCACAAQNRDAGALLTQNCPQAPTSCSSCISYPGYGWDGSSCQQDGPACRGRSQWYYTSCSRDACAVACTSYTISGNVSSSSGGVSGAEVCLDPTTSGSCAGSSFRTTTVSGGNYTINGVPTGGNGHTVYVVPNGFTVTNNSQNVGSSVCQTTTRNFTVIYPSTQGYLAQFERCIGGSWTPIPGNRCTTSCGISDAPPPEPEPEPEPEPAPEPEPGPAPGGSAWIQTTGGDVHSNIKINTPGGPQ